MCSKQGLSQQTLRASFWHPDPRKIPIFSSFFKGGGGEAPYLLVRIF